MARLAASFVGDPLRLVGGKPFERRQLVYDLPFRRLVLTNDAKAIEGIMIDRGGRFPKSAVVHSLLKPLIGDGVFGQPGGDAVKETRRLLARSLAAIEAEEIASVTRKVGIAYMRDWVAQGHVPMGSAFSRLAVDIVSECTLGGRFDEAESRRFTDLFSTYHLKAKALLLMLARDDRHVRSRIVSEMGLEAIGREMRALISARFLEMRDDRRRDPVPAFARMVADHAERSPAHPSLMLDEVAVMLLAGHETTASTLSWLAYELARNPELQASASAIVAGQATPETPLSAFSGVQIVDALGNEALRLYPPIGFFLRENEEDVSMQGISIPKGSFLVVSPRSLHRHKKYWARPDEFVPERWLTAPEAPARTTFMPFGMGARICPGARFAGIELAELIRLMLVHLKFELTPGQNPLPLGNLTSRPEPDIVLKVTPRAPFAEGA